MAGGHSLSSRQPESAWIGAFASPDIAAQHSAGLRVGIDDLTDRPGIGVLAGIAMFASCVPQAAFGHLFFALLFLAGTILLGIVAAAVLLRASPKERISADMDKVRADVNSAYRFAPAVAPAPRPQPLSEVNATVTAGQKRQLAVLFTLNLDCSSMGYATVTTVEPVQHGKVAVEHGTGTPNFPQGNPRVECNKPGTEGTVIVYEPNPGFTGPDALVVDIVYADKSSVRRRYSINVNPSREAAATPTNPPGETGPGTRVEPTPPRPASPNPPPITEVTRVAIADQTLQVVFLYDINPDCSVIGLPSVRIVEQPKSGKVAVEKGTGFPAFPANNSRFKCNSNRAEGMIISYTPNPGYTGADSIVTDIIYPDGNAVRRRYAIDVR
jgi:hypothetical protein